MKFRELLNKLATLTEDQLDTEVVIHDMIEDEFYGSGSGITFEVADTDHDVLHENHPIICIRK